MDALLSQAEEEDKINEVLEAAIDLIKRKKCCLLLGPELKAVHVKSAGNNYEKISILEAFCRFLDTGPRGDNGSIDQKDFYYKAGRFIAKNYPNKPFSFKDEVNNFKGSILQSSSATHRFLAKLPFHTIVNLVPDQLLNNTLRELGYEFGEDYYNYKGAEKKHIDGLFQEMQLVYNLFGNYHDTNSVAFTEKDEFWLIKNLTSKSPKLPESLTGRCNDEENSFLFLDFDFNKWYFRLIFDALQIPKPTLSLAPRLGHLEDVAFITHSYYTEQYSFGFIPDSTENFLKSLVKAYNNKFPLDRKINIVFDFHVDDNLIFTALLNSLKLGGLSKRANFWSRSDILLGAIEETVDNMNSSADVFISFLSTPYLLNEVLRNRLIKALNNPKQSVITLKANYCTENNAIPNIAKAYKRLPLDTVPLASDLAQLTRKCEDLVKFINAILR